MKKTQVAILLLFLLMTIPVTAQHLDLAVNGYGLSLGNSTMINGVRINWSDDQV